jgi:anti-sigma factor RsiW
MTIDAPVTDDDLQAYADNELGPARRPVVTRYLEQNPEAARKVEAIVAQTATVRAAAAPLLDPSIPHRLSIDALFERERRFGRQARSFSAQPWHRIAAAFLGVFILGAASGWGLHTGSGPSPGSRIRPLVEEAADSYAVYEPDRLHPVEIRAADRDALMSWVTSRLQRPVWAPQAIGDFRQLGGRVVATSRGPAAMFMYENAEGKRIVMLVCPLSLHGTAPITDTTLDGLSGVSWSDRGVGYSLVGPVPADVLHDLGELIHSQTAGGA